MAGPARGHDVDAGERLRLRGVRAVGPASLGEAGGAADREPPSRASRHRRHAPAPAHGPFGPGRHGGFAALAGGDRRRHPQQVHLPGRDESVRRQQRSGDDAAGPVPPVVGHGAAGAGTGPGPQLQQPGHRQHERLPVHLSARGGQPGHGGSLQQYHQHERLRPDRPVQPLRSGARQRLQLRRVPHRLREALGLHERSGSQPRQLRGGAAQPHAEPWARRVAAPWRTSGATSRRIRT